MNKNFIVVIIVIILLIFATSGLQSNPRVLTEKDCTWTSPRALNYNVPYTCLDKFEKVYCESAIKYSSVDNVYSVCLKYLK